MMRAFKPSCPSASTSSSPFNFVKAKLLHARYRCMIYGRHNNPAAGDLFNHTYVRPDLTIVCASFEVCRVHSTFLVTAFTQTLLHERIMYSYYHPPANLHVPFVSRIRIFHVVPPADPICISRIFPIFFCTINARNIITPVYIR